MAQTNTTRFKLPQWSAGTDNYPGRTGFNNFLKLLEDQAAIVYPSGPISSRPASGVFGRFYLANDQGGDGRLYYDGGSGWVELNTNGGGGAGRALAIGGTAVEGSSNRSARADHTHPLPLASGSGAGAMSAAQYEILNSAATTVTASALVRRTSSGNIAVPTTPAGNNDAASKAYVDSRGGGSSDVDNATGNIVPGALVRRGSDGGFLVPTPTHVSHPTTKTYVDGHTWDGESLRQNGNDVWWEIIGGSTKAYSNVQSGTVFTVSVNSIGKFMRFSSKRADKDRIVELNEDPRRLLAPVPVSYVRRDSESGQAPPNARTEWGFIADDEQSRLPELVLTVPDENGVEQVESWDNNGLIAAHQLLHRWNAERVDTQAREIEELKADRDTQATKIWELEDTVAQLTLAVRGLTG
jgi:hypothetical protein